jgi:hypothetical protein
MATVQEAWALAAADESAMERLWNDPATFGVELGLRGAALAELIGGVRFGRRGHDEGAEGLEVLRASINVENGWGTWPWTDVPDSEFSRFAALTEQHTNAIVRRRFYDVAASSTDAYLIAWAEALRDEAVARAEASAGIAVEIADALIAARGLLDALARGQ